MPVSAEGRVEHQKLNQAAAMLWFGWAFGVQLDLVEKTISANAEKSADLIPSFLDTQFLSP